MKELKNLECEMNEEKIGMYTVDELYEELANGFLQRSMVDAMYFEIKSLQEKIKKLEIEKKSLEKELKSIDK